MRPFLAAFRLGVHLDTVLNILRQRVSRASSPAGSSGVSPRESSGRSAWQRDAAGTRSRGRLRHKNSVKLHPPGVISAFCLDLSAGDGFYVKLCIS